MKSLSNNYEFANDLCGYTLIKRQICEIRDISAAFHVDGSAEQIQKGPQRDQFHGILFKNVAIGQCCCFSCPLCFKLSYEVNGYNTKLTEVEILKAWQLSSHLVAAVENACCPEYDVTNSANNVFGKIKLSCLRRLLPCCAQTTVTNINLSTNYKITRDCGSINCCTISWTVREAATDSVASDFKLAQCCGFCPKYSLNFTSIMNQEDKLLLLSSIPFLP